MSNRHRFIALRAPWTLTLLRFPPGATTFLTEDAASIHSLFSSEGYVGSLPSVRPLPPHAFSTYRDTIRGFENYERVYNDGRGSDFGSGSCLHPTVAHSVEFFPGIDFSNVYAQALDKLNDKVRGDLDLSVDIAEAHQTAKMLRVKDRVIDYTKLFSKKFGLLRSIASLRLEYMYGVKPLLKTLYGAADESLRLVINKSAKFSARAVDKTYKVDHFRVNCYWGPQLFDARDLNLKVSTTVGVDVRTDQFDLSRWATLNPIGIAWELMPYSFVVDWFLNVGGYLRNMETYLLNNNKFRSGYRTDFLAFDGSGVSDFPIPSGSTGTDRITVSIEGFRLDRSVLNAYPIPDLPQLQANLGSSRLLNGAALLAQFLGRR